MGDSKASAKGFGHIDTNALAHLIDSKVPVIILDARTGQYDDGKRIATAQTLNGESSSEQVSKVIPSKKSLIVVYCSNTQCPASMMLATHLSELGYSHILKYDQGIQGWIESGYPIR